MNKTGLILSLIGIIILLISAIYISLELQKEFLLQLGFTGLFLYVSVIFFDICKVLSEITFFKVSNKARIIIFIYMILFISTSIYATWTVRIWKADIMLSQIEFQNISKEQESKIIGSDINRKIELIENRRTDYHNQLEMYDKQIEAKINVMNSLDPKKDKKSISGYSWELQKLQEKKDIIFEELQQFEDSITGKEENLFEESIIESKPIVKKEISLFHSIENAFNISGKNFMNIANFFLALIIDSSIIFLSFITSYLSKLISKKDIPAIHKENKRDISKIKDTYEKNILTDENKSYINVLLKKLSDEGYVNRHSIFREIRKTLKLTQNELAERLNTNQTIISLCENKEGGEIPPTILKKLEKLIE